MLHGRDEGSNPHQKRQELCPKTVEAYQLASKPPLGSISTSYDVVDPQNEQDGAMEVGLVKNPKDVPIYADDPT